MQKKSFSTEIEGKELHVEFNDLAENADGSVLIKLGDTTVLVTAVMSKEESSMPFFPLTVDYEEKFYAAGVILGSRFMRREGRPSDEAILSARMIDRTIRPLFDQRVRNEIQIVITVLSIGEDDPDILSILGTSLALATSDIPWNGPVSAVRIGKKLEDGSILVNPTYPEREEVSSNLDMVICGKEDGVTMLEAGAYEVSENDISLALDKGRLVLQKLQDFQKKIVQEMGKDKRTVHITEVSEEVKELFSKEIEPKMAPFVFSKTPGKDKITELKNMWKTVLKDNEIQEIDLAKEYFEQKVDEMIHIGAIEEDKRADGRKIDEVRPLYAQAGGISNILHGSGIFYRGGTHILSALTLGGPSDAQIVDGIEVRNNSKRFMHHYNFPPFSVGETGRMGGMNRRMIGHGALAEKAMIPVIPTKEDFPYTIRIVSEALASNGSTSMGSICGSTLALMDAGVPIKAPVAGIAMGLVVDQKDSNKYKILTDIQGPEDHYGDMDCKVAGTRKGITAVQMDTKLEQISFEAIKETVEKAKAARLQILDVIEQEIVEPRKEVSPNAPSIIILSINPKDIGTVIGPGGKTINGIKDVTGADIDIEDDGSIYITAPNQEKGQLTKTAIEELVRKYEKGDEIEGEVVRIVDFGAFVKIGPNTDGLVHVSEIASFRVEKVEDYLKVGDRVPVVVKEVDEKGRISLSIKQRDPDFIKK